ncbi:hypothetical protein [Rubripirellula reticaptiva]|uniref:Stigma-specific protein, Stig1 n=1 Tax=Rubripirellula reticaptiva TaxID=2528013 RepID=A0A5C6F772_9BACT|nr:hypothetical protein [Rubripirellula reticaptiva]TWU57238.1 hypothetical protein Poly59_01450 [Rubripirellula reticaptiva]
MRISALSIAIVVANVLAPQAFAKNDFSALLADLSFGDAPPSARVVQNQSNNASAFDIDEALTLSAPTQLESAAVETTEVFNAVDKLVPVPQSFAMPSFAEVPAKVSLQAPIAVAPHATDAIDLNAAFALQDLESSQTSVSAQSVGFGHHGSHSGPLATAIHGNHGCASGVCDSVSDCTPHVAPCLPSSTLLQYFRTSKCNTHVWDGYQQKCGFGQKHVNGTCDCFKQRQGCGQLLPACNGPSCDGPSCRGCDSCRGSNSCDSGCDR